MGSANVVRASIVGLVLAFATWSAVAAAQPPADAFCVILIEPSSDFALIRVLVDEETSLEQRAALWPSVDQDGNGIVSEVEKDAFRWSNTQAFPNETDLGVKAVTLWPDAPYTKSSVQKAVYAATWRQVGHVFHHQNYRLPDRLTQSSELETQEVREFGFELEPGRSSRFTLSGGRDLVAASNLSAAPTYSDQPRPVIEYVVVQAPEGWLVQRIQGQSYNGTFVLTPGQRSVDVPAFDTKKPYNITFLNPALEKKLGDIGSPGPGVILGLLGVVAAVWVRARRST